MQLGMYLKLLTVKEVGLYGVVGGVVTYMFGGWTGLLEVFFIALALDWITGIAASIYQKKTIKALNSKINFWGGVKKFFMVLTVYFAHRIDLAFDLKWLMAGCIYFWLANELISISENFGRMNMSFPAPLKKFITILKDKSESKEANDTEQK